MSVTLDHMLMLAGWLDDQPGFDSPRERLRRFLREHVTSVGELRALVAAAQHAPGDQHQRALQDLVALAGRFLGFEVTFSKTIAHGQGVWQSSSRLHVVLDVRSAPKAADAIQALGVAASTLSRDLPPGARVSGLCVVTPLSFSRRDAEEASRQGPAEVPLTVATLATVLSLAELVSAGRLTHDDVAKLLEAGAPLDLVVNLVGRSVPDRAPEPSLQPSPLPEIVTTPSTSEDAPAEAARSVSGFWIAEVVPDFATTPEEFLDVVVARRQVFGISAAVAAGTVSVGDSICFFIPARGVVGHARVSSFVAGASGLRDARRFGQVLGLADVTMYVDQPIATDSETALRLRAVPRGPRRQAPVLVEMSRESFSAVVSAVAARRGRAAVEDASAERDVDPSAARLTG